MLSKRVHESCKFLKIFCKNDASFLLSFRMPLVTILSVEKYLFVGRIEMYGSGSEIEWIDEDDSELPVGLRIRLDPCR